MQSINKISRDCPLLKSPNVIAFEQAFGSKKTHTEKRDKSEAYKALTTSRKNYSYFWNSFARI